MDLKFDALLFDKDGTLFDFKSSWGPWYATLIGGLQKDKDAAMILASLLHFDLVKQEFGAESILIHGAISDFLDIVMPSLPHWNRAELSEFVELESHKVVQIPVLPLAPLFDSFLAQGITLGIATNDNEAPAITQLKAAGIEDRFAFIAGCDSGYGAKPASGMQHGFCEKTGIAAHNTVMVGDSRHDLVSGRNAGMKTIAVLTGIATEAELAPYADIVLRDIGEISGLMG